MLLELDFKKRNLTLMGTSIVGFILAILLWSHPLALALFICTLVFLLTGNRPTTVYAVVVTMRRDICIIVRFFLIYARLLKHTWRGKTFPILFREVVQRNPNKVALMLEDRKWTFQNIENFSNRLGSYFKSKGLKRGDTISLMMETRLEYPAIWIGLSKIGVTTALINTNLVKDQLAHSINVAKSKAIIVSTELSGALDEVRNREEIKNIPVYQFKDPTNLRATTLEHYADFVDLTAELESHQTTDITNDMLEGKLNEHMLYIYTSGTTGLPKAAVITHLRFFKVLFVELLDIILLQLENMGNDNTNKLFALFYAKQFMVREYLQPDFALRSMFISLAAYESMSLYPDDVIYNPLPIYHIAGGMMGLGCVLLNGLTMAMRKKFSASNFWLDCIKYECTTAQYIGELCRYLLAVPQKPVDTQHKIRIMFGNGLKPQIWKTFVSRFNIPNIVEFYGATEGNSNLVNFDNQIGAVGFIPLFFGALYPVKLIKCEEDTGEPIRGPDGRCILCKTGEAGVFIGKIRQKIVSSAFSGYADKESTEKKILRNVFKEGDMYFNSSDILVRDILGYYYFKDRTGDTFRWRGENVSTSEVEAVVSNILGLKDCVVYGVQIPHVEGRAGMVAIVDPENTIDMESFSAGIRGSLPPYSRPLFIRLIPEVPMTGTFKLMKKELHAEGYDIYKIKNPLYYLSRGVYRPFTQEDYDDILNGTAGL